MAYIKWIRIGGDYNTPNKLRANTKANLSLNQDK